MARDELLTSQGELRGSKEELRATNDDLRVKIELLDGARREASEAVSSAERLIEECCGLRGDLHQQVTLVAKWDEIIGMLRDDAYTQWVSRWLAFQRKAANVYLGLDFNLTYLVTRRPRSPYLLTTPKNQVPVLKPTPPLHCLLLLLMPDLLCTSSLA